MYDIEKLYEAYTVDEAIEILKNHPDAKIIGGGSDVLIKIREGKMAGATLLSIYLIEELRGVTLEEDGTLRIGALTSFSHIANDELIKKHFPLIGEAVMTAGGPQLRNIATIGGNISNGVPSADSATTLLAWDAIVEVKGENGVREIPITEFYIKTGVVDIKPTEIVTAVKIKKESYENYYGYYFKYAMRNAMDIATSTCSINCKFDGTKILDIRVAFGVAAPIPVRAPKSEAFLKGKELNEENIKEFLKIAATEISPRDSWRASKELRAHILNEIAKRCLIESYNRYKGGQHE